LPAIALGLEPTEDDIMLHKPEKNAHGIFSYNLWQRIILEGVMIGLISIMVYSIGNVYYDLKTARTMSFATLSISQLVHVFNMRSEKSIFKVNLFSNKYLFVSFLLCCSLQILVIVYMPLCNVFHTKPLDLIQWAIVFVLSLLPIFIVEIEKYYSKKCL
jgi:Ca2+-transporting ATPase